MIDRAIALVGLGITLLIGLYAFAPEGWPKIPTWLTLSGLGVGVFLCGIGVGLVIADQRSPIMAAAQKPEFHLHVAGGNIFTPDGIPSATGIALETKIWNTGAPSIVTSWTMKVIPNGGSAVIAQLTAMPNVLTARGNAGSSRILAKDSLEEKTKAKEVGATPVEGILLFYVLLPHEVVTSSETVLILTAKDINEKEASFTQLVGNWLQRPQ